MFSKNELKLAYGVAACLLAIGVISYAAFPLKAPEEPLRIMYTLAAGNVLFNHKMHTAEGDYGLSCFDCHHHPLDDESSLIACSDCHAPPAEGEAVNETCLDCHDESEIEDSEIVTGADAFHLQCGGCHKDFGAGPTEKECAKCHAL